MDKYLDDVAIETIREALKSVPGWVDDPKGEKKRIAALALLDAESPQSETLVAPKVKALADEIFAEVKPQIDAEIKARISAEPPQADASAEGLADNIFRFNENFEYHPRETYIERWLAHVAALISADRRAERERAAERADEWHMKMIRDVVNIGIPCLDDYRQALRAAIIGTK